jgi:hypothetical protein
LKAAARFVATLNPCALFLALSATLLGHAIQEGNGFYNPTALNWLIAALLCAVVGLACHRTFRESSERGVYALRAVIGASIAWQFYELFTSAPGIYIADGNIGTFHLWLAVQMSAITVGFFGLPNLTKFWFPTLLGASLLLGGWMIQASPDPYIDVVTVHREAIDALLRGANPYRISLPNIYEEQMARMLYNPDAIFGNRINIAFPYPPPSLLLAVPGHLLLGDYRYSEVVLLVAAAALIGYSRRGLTPKLAAALLLTTPRTWFVIEQGWTEPVTLFMLALAVFLLIRGSIPAALATGILIITKQYMGFGGLAAVRQVFMRPKDWMRASLAGVGIAAAVILPFYFSGPNAFMRNVVYLQMYEPFRLDSLSFLSWAANNGYGQGSFVWAIGAAVAAAVITLLATRNSPSGFATAIALTTFMMFAFGSKAFCNYYFFVIGALCCAIGAFPPPGEPEFVTESTGRRITAATTR